MEAPQWCFIACRFGCICAPLRTCVTDQLCHTQSSQVKLTHQHARLAAADSAGEAAGPRMLRAPGETGEDGTQQLGAVWGLEVAIAQPLALQLQVGVCMRDGFVCCEEPGFLVNQHI